MIPTARYFLAASLAAAQVLSAGIAWAAPRAELIPMWHASDDASGTTVDHGAWQEILDAYLSEHPSGIHRLDYGALQASGEHREQLTAYIGALAAIDPRALAKAEQMAYWINLYNAVTVSVVTEHYPVESIQDISDSLFTFGPWTMELVTVAGQPLTLDDIEHGILRPIWRDPRIHYAANCASLGCPNLATQAYRADNLEALLEQGATDYINHPRGARETEDGLLVSSIYDWFQEDFGGTDAGVFTHLKRHATPELAEALDRYTDFDDEYDWRLNAP